MVSDLLRDFQLAAVLQIRRDAGRFRPPADDAMGVLLKEGIGW